MCSSPTPAAQRPGFRSEGTRRDLLSLVLLGDASGGNSPSLLANRWAAFLE